MRMYNYILTLNKYTAGLPYFDSEISEAINILMKYIIEHPTTMKC